MARDYVQRSQLALLATKTVDLRCCRRTAIKQRKLLTRPSIERFRYRSIQAYTVHFAALPQYISTDRNKMCTPF